MNSGDFGEFMEMSAFSSLFLGPKSGRQLSILWDLLPGVRVSAYIMLDTGLVFSCCACGDTGCPDNTFCQMFNVGQFFML